VGIKTGFMKFEKGKSSPFFNGLNFLVDEYFQKRKKHRYASAGILVKGTLLLGVYLFCYAGIYFFQQNIMALVLLYILLGLSGVMIVFNLVHDASHDAISTDKKTNNYIRYLGDLVGINTYIWDIRHNVQHHSFTNVLGGDIVIENIPLLRISPHQPLKKFHRYQQYYSPLLYMFYSFYWIFVIDFKLFFQKEICNLKHIRHPRKEWVKLISFKLFYIMYMIVLPAMFTPMGWKLALLLFLLMHAAGGLLLSFVAVLGHFVNGPVFPEAPGGKINNSWSEHELEATIDFAPSSKIINWITGGLNTHVAHHLFPHISHAHYYDLTQIIEQYCRTHDYPYRKETLPGALKSHFQFLKMLGNGAV
jgi:linoleoyl-CoA desaturase